MALRDMMITARKPPESISYKLEHSAALAIGIDATRRADRGSHGVSSQAVHTAAGDVKYIRDCLVSEGVVSKENSLVYSSQSDNDQCSFKGIQEAFKQQLSKVEADGLFAFVFSGPAATVAVGESASQSCSLKATDFDPSDGATHLTAATIGKWLTSVPTKVKHVLLIIDSPLAETFAAEMMEVDKHRPSGDYSLCVLSAQNGSEKSFIIDTLGHSFFAYFLVWAIQTTAFTPGLIPLRSIFKKAQECCTALSSLIVTYATKERELKQNTVTPGASYSIPERVLKNLDGDSDEGTYETDGAVGQYEFLTKHYARSKAAKKIKLHDKVHAFLEMAAVDESSALSILNKHDLLQEKVLLTVVNLLMFSIASIQVAEDQKSVSDPNLFIVSFLTSTATVSSVKCDVELTPVDLFRRSKDYYMQVVRDNGVDYKKLDELFTKVNDETIVAG